VKANQPKLRQALEDAFAEAPETGSFEQTERGHGRRLARHAEVLANTGLVDPELWPGCRTLGCIFSLRAEADKRPQVETRYYISSAALSSEQLDKAVRQHWAIENDLHWRLDVMMREDACGVSRDNAPENLSIIRRIILNALKLVTRRIRRKVSACDARERAGMMRSGCASWE
jgi:predicted transposase YbfD/YdcC